MLPVRVVRVVRVGFFYPDTLFVDLALTRSSNYLPVRVVRVVRVF